MFLNPMDTSICKMYPTRQIINELKSAYVNNRGVITLSSKDDQGFHDIIQVIGNVSSTNIPSFSHPIVIELEVNGKLRNQVFIDIREVSKVVTAENDIRITKKMDHDNLVNRALLQLEWFDRGAGSLNNMLGFSAHVFTRWLAGMISRRYALDPSAEAKCSIIVAYYYLGLFKDLNKMTDMDLMKWKNSTIRRISKITNISARMIESEYSDFVIPRNAVELCATLKGNVGSVRLEDLDYPALLEVLGRASWFGSNSREIVAVSLEHPPTFISLVYDGLEERGYRKTMIGTIALDDRRQEEAKALINEMNSIRQDHYTSNPVRS